MIFDHITNLSTYKTLSADIFEGLHFLQQVSPDIAIGTYQINPRVKAIVSEYETKVKNEVGYEAHRKNIDIQYLLRGEERIACLPSGIKSITDNIKLILIFQIYENTIN